MMNSRSRSVPEGLAMPNGDIHWDSNNRPTGYNFHRTPSRPFQVLEQITTSVWPKINLRNFLICVCVYVIEGIVAFASWDNIVVIRLIVIFINVKKHSKRDNKSIFPYCYIIQSIDFLLLDRKIGKNRESYKLISSIIIIPTLLEETLTLYHLNFL